MSEPPTPQASHRYLPLLLILFVGSGCSALIYEIVWFQLLQFAIGSTAISLGVLLGTFMGGMCIGSLVLPRLIPARLHPLRVYATLELLIGVIAIVVFFAMPSVVTFYLKSIGQGTDALSLSLRAGICAACLLPPTILMGATLPAIARWIQLTPRGVAWLGFFYGGNIAGAVFGSLLAGFYLLRLYDMQRATYVAAAINFAVAIAAFVIAGFAGRVEQSDDLPVLKPVRVAGAWTIYLGIALSGLTALGAEVVWTRLLSLALGGTVYTFSIILAVFLLGLGIGSSVGALLARSLERPALALGWCQLLLTGAIAWSAYTIAASIPYWPIDPKLPIESIWTMFQFDLARCAWAILPATILWGAAFPLALAAVAPPGADSGKIVGGVYAANTVGAIAGAMLCSLVIIPNWHPYLDDPWWKPGTQNCERFLIAVAMLSGLIVLVPAMLRNLRNAGMAGISVSVAAVAVAALLIRYVPQTPGGLIAYGRQLPTNLHWFLDNQLKVVYMGEGLNSSIVVTEQPDGVRNFHVSGKVEASNLPQDMRMERMLGHIAALVHPHPESSLVVGCGAGITSGSLIIQPSMKRLVLCELEPLIPQVVAGYFEKENYNVVHDPRCHITYDDARHFMLTASEKFDIITSDPIHPWVKGSASLYTREYYELVKKRLNPGGVVTQWVPLYESNEEAVKSEIATFQEVFPNSSVWANDYSGLGYDVILVGSTDDLKIDIDALQKRLDREDHYVVQSSLDQVGWHSAVELLSCYAGQVKDMKPWLDENPAAEINTDQNLRLMYSAGMGLNLLEEENIYKQILRGRKFHDEIFTGSDAQKNALKKAMGMQ